MLAIIDGDVLAYGACRPRWESKAHIEGEISYVYLDENGKRKSLEFTKDEDRYYLEDSWANFKSDLSKMTDSLFCNEFVMAVGGQDNFRCSLFPPYKMNRHKDPSKQNIFVPTIRKLAVFEGLAVFADGFEADDLIRMWAEEARLYNKDYIICSIDKDLKCIPGTHYNTKKKTLEEISPEVALRHYYCQLLKGDPTDNVLGVPRVGEVKAEKILAPLSTEEEYQEAVVDQYMKAYGDDWYWQLLVNGRMIYLLRHPQDYFDPMQWAVVREVRKEPSEEVEVENEIHRDSSPNAVSSGIGEVTVEQRALEVPGADGATG
jgi:5'-3' exonuclease, N-terminal resolvase-like domain